MIIFRLAFNQLGVMQDQSIGHGEILSVLSSFELDITKLFHLCSLVFTDPPIDLPAYDVTDSGLPIVDRVYNASMVLRSPDAIATTYSLCLEVLR